MTPLWGESKAGSFGPGFITTAINFQMQVMRMKQEKNPLYLVLHIPKCAGTTMKRHIRESFPRDQVIFACIYSMFFNIKTSKYEYYGQKNRQGIIKYIRSLAQEQIDNIRIIQGHDVWYGMHTLFGDRTCRYVTLVREPVHRAVSSYNFMVGVIKNHEKKKVDSEYTAFMETRFRNYEKIMLKQDRVKRFTEWLAEDYGADHPIIAQKTMVQFLHSRGFVTRNPGKEDIRDCIDKFYFIGTTSNYQQHAGLPDNMFGANKVVKAQNVSKKYYVLKKDDTKTRSLIIQKNKPDQALYECAVEANRRFKQELDPASRWAVR